ncbi:hypothetical protein C475_11715 [Halosimplex carlsbadense 2-9-1]|uniref:Uncharacterized protein n=1 Tax=Halosimplex carlsbadense 2-9-1 TaxID=797114 RepID=M0CR81_9EURY|nr:hypothetical protein [Halosimplex carlsbadense]ELZ24902.1 hypothetical protein C475_11715 [Halosimplex carlsbadense 2-9-1]
MTLDLPYHLDRELVEQYAKESDTMLEFTRTARISRDDAKRILKHYDLSDKVKTAGDTLLGSPERAAAVSEQIEQAAGNE